jgi:hypothetical protein
MQQEGMGSRSACQGAIGKEVQLVGNDACEEQGRAGKDHPKEF